MKHFRKLTTSFTDPGDFEDATEVYGDRETYDLLDSDNDCIEPGGHVFLAQCGAVRCIYCKTRVG